MQTVIPLFRIKCVCSISNMWFRSIAGTGNNISWLVRKMQLADVLYNDLFNNLPKEKQSELTGRKGYFAKKAGIIL